MEFLIQKYITSSLAFISVTTWCAAVLLRRIRSQSSLPQLIDCVVKTEVPINIVIPSVNMSVAS